MTSLEFFAPNNTPPPIPCDWGTGRNCKEAVGPPDDHAPPSWQYTNEPKEEPIYQISPLQLSNNRLNDELIPRPEHFDASGVVIRKPFPAEHPYSSHISRFAVFPTSSSSDGKGRGPPKVIVARKTKGFDGRVERVVGTALDFRWPEDGFNHVPKNYGPTNEIYPIPPKLFLPNDDRPSSLPVKDGNIDTEADRQRSVSNAIADVERKRWMTSYCISNLGVSDLFHKQKSDMAAQGFVQTSTEKTMNSSAGRTADPMNCSRKLTFNEREELRLLNGTTYVNYPQNVDPSTLDRCYFDPLPKVDVFSALQESGHCSPKDVVAMETKVENPYQLLRKQQHEKTQEMEARNRWRLLESQTPKHDIAALRRRMDISSTKHQPEVFYDHEGRYQRERAGMYLTSYDPALLAHSMNRLERNGASLTDTSDCHKNALDLPTDLNVHMAEVNRYNRSLCGSVPQLHDQPSQFEVYGPFNAAKALQKRHLLPDGSLADVRTQEGDIIYKQTTYGVDYNIPKFLQDHPPIPIHARNEPMEVMSTSNQIIANIPRACPVVRLHTAPTTPESAASRKDLFAYPASQARVLNSTRFREREKLIQKQTGMECHPPPQSQRSYLETDCGPWHYDLSHRLETRFQPVFSCPGDTKTETRKKFEQCFPSRTPDLRENNCSGKKHNFQGNINAQVLRGAALVTA